MYTNQRQHFTAGVDNTPAILPHINSELPDKKYRSVVGDWKGLPMYNTPVNIPFTMAYQDERIYKPQYYLRHPRYKGCEFGALFTGESMRGVINHGDFVVCKEVTDHVVPGGIYYVVATNGLEACRYVTGDPSNSENLLLTAANEEFDPCPLPKSMIHKIFKVQGIIRGY